MTRSPSARIWRRVNTVILGENAAEVLVTLISGLSRLIVAAGVVTTEEQGRAHLAAMCLSPDSGEIGSLEHLLGAEYERLRNQGRS